MKTRPRSTTALAAAILVLVTVGCSIDAEGPAASPLTSPQCLMEAGAKGGASGSGRPAECW